METDFLELVELVQRFAWGQGIGVNPLQAALQGIDPDALTPREALDRLYQLKKLSQTP